MTNVDYADEKCLFAFVFLLEIISFLLETSENVFNLALCHVNMHGYLIKLKCVFKECLS